MKKLLLTLLVSIFCITTYAQNEISEPEFAGEVLVVDANGGTKKLEKQTVQLRTRTNAGAMLVGIGKRKTKITIEGSSAKTQLNGADKICFIIKAIDNRTDPVSIVSIFRLESTKDKRMAEMASMSTFGSVKTNKLEYLPFDAKKFGESSYYVQLTEQPVGEYGIIISNPNNVDEKQIVVSTFGIQ